MKKILTLLPLALFLQTSVFSQDTPRGSLKKTVKVNLGFDGLAVAFEPKLISSLSLEVNAGIGGYYNIAEGNFNYNLNPRKPAFHVEINQKFFYNRNRRVARNKKTDLNSGNYFGLSFKYATKSISSSVFSDRVTLYNVHYGIQRSITRRIIWNATGGIGYADKVDNKFGTAYPALGLSISYIF